jgi:5-epi-alpha-selinene synthase
LVVELTRSANLVASLANDIFSLRKETANRDVHNIVMVLEQEESLSRKAACLRAIELHDAQVRHYCRLEKLLPSFGDAIDGDLARYCAGMRIWMRANYDWSTVTPRYN